MNAERMPRIPFRAGPLTGFRYAELDERVTERIERWAKGELPGEAEAIKPERVFRDGSLLVKRFPPESNPLKRLRKPRAIRSADLARDLFPVRTAQPYVALAGTDGSGLLVTEFIEGEALPDVRENLEQARAQFPLFIASIIQRGLLLGDFHVYNALWDGRSWALIDLDGLRHGLHRLNAKRLLETVWGRVWIGMGRDPSVRELYEEFLVHAEMQVDVNATWTRIVDRANERYPHV